MHRGGSVQHLLHHEPDDLVQVQPHQQEGHHGVSLGQGCRVRVSKPGQVLVLVTNSYFFTASSRFYIALVCLNRLNELEGAH